MSCAIDFADDAAAIRDALAQRRGSLRIALVKQTTYTDLYIARQGATAAETLFSSTYRSGPAALLSYFNADFIIADVPDDVECSIWKEKVYHCEHLPVETYESMKDNAYIFGAKGNREFVQNVDDIDWSKYDIVISLDIAVPRRIVERYKSVLWAYLITEGCMGSYAVSSWRRIANYDCFLNMAFRLDDSNNAAHEINFPYHLQYFGCFGEIDSSLSVLDQDRSGAVLDTTSARHVSADTVQALEGLVGLNGCGGNIKSHLTALSRSKYYLRMGGGAKQGNSIPEAISAGCLFLANRYEFNNADTFTNNTYVDTWEEAIATIKQFEEDGDAFRNTLQSQRAQIEYTCFLRPMSKLIDKFEAKRAT